MRDIFPIGFDCLLNFSGHKEGPKAYKKWQKKMEDWFFAYNIPKHRKVRYAEKTLKGEALKWWEDELEMVDCYDEPDHSWSSMRFLMFEEFVMNAASQEVSSKDEQVSRTKLFEEGEYDVARKSTKEILEPVIQPREEDGPTIIGDVTKSAEQTPEPHSRHNDVKINVENSGANLSTISGHVESSSKWNQAILSSYEKDMNFTSQVFSIPPVSDICSVIWMQRPIHMELSCKPSWYDILIQIRSFEKWKHTKPVFYEGIIDFTSQANSKLAGLDPPSLFEDLRADDKGFGYKVNCFEILTHQGESGALNHINRSYNEGVMDFPNKCNLQLPYLEAHEFGGNQGCDWRPEDFLIRLESSKKNPRCILSLWIFGIQYPSLIHKDLLFQIKGAIKVIILQPFIPYQDGRLEMLLRWFQIVPRHSSYGPKLSRLKTKNRRFRF